MSIKRGDVGGTGDGTLNTIDQIVAQVAAEIRLKTAEAKMDANRAEAAADDALEYRDQTEQLKNQAEDSVTTANQAAASALDSSVQADISRAEAETKANEAAASATVAEDFALQAEDAANLALQYKNDAAQEADRAELEADRAEYAADSIESASVPLFFVTWCPDRNHIWPGYVAADGQQLSSATYPDAAAGIAAGTVPTTDDATWLADPTQRGKYVADDGSGFFRVPDYNGKQAGSLGAVFLRGDGERSAGVSGEIQEDAFQNITGSFNQGGHSPSGSGAFYTGNKSNSNSGLASDARIIHFDASRVARTADETRPLNVTGCWIIKLYGAVLENGTANLTQLLSDYNTLSNDIDFTIIYPNGGTEENPANVTTNSRYVESNPFPGHYVRCVAELLIDGQWGEVGFVNAASSNSGYGIAARQLSGGDIVVQTGSAGLSTVNSSTQGSPHGYNTQPPNTLPCRVKVWKLKGAI